MPRVARGVISGAAHHVTQRGNGRQFILASDAERLVYLDLLRQARRERPASVLGYCWETGTVTSFPISAKAMIGGLENRKVGDCPGFPERGIEILV